MADQIKIEILPDGTIKSVTESVGAENHQSAEGFFGMLSRLTGGKASRKGRGDTAHHHHHHDTEEHQHN